MEFSHVPVLLEECIQGLAIRPSGIYVDGTAGGAGHSREIAKRLGPQGRLIAIDKDPDAVAIAGERLREFPQATVVQNDFANIPLVLDELGIDRVDGILLDLGVSSHQLDTAERGFSYNFDAPLDMRMSQSGLSAYDIVNTYSVEDITRILREFSEEKFAYRIAQNIEKARQQKPVETTFELVEIIKQSIPAAARREGGHPAKRTFQALRIAVNQELDHLSICLDDAFERLAPGGRFAVITFHSLEDRMVKQKFAALAKGCICPPDFPVCVCGHKPRAKLVNRKPIEATAEELAANKRSHSAKLRVCERLPEGEEQQG
ncbi:16S rRNA (cytosine(1402)-N(4))-methyltransferase RsmH [Merdimmobilis hominis]|uniref:Ribosomal RNA small subunit methyltransferase H n=1 Tax=uncultured Anaerotruncus sp. TaxID=905011 RepID=A0A6N2T4E7_9FIRM|nr:16S rRNA (cytosine(1402)-N(4))-methyltransferase RsmH [Merdimmobilis hominis]MCD4835982.1 16S rRNA (cytosine(1402)-N(4))-methyltransferase RsmH [Merdimmobilis hominis]